MIALTSDEVKQMYSMRDIVERYRMQINKAGYTNCPFHNEKTASMKIYKDSYHCFGCGETGDIFTFVQRMNNFTFREALEELSGKDISFSTYLEIKKAQDIQRKKKLKAAEQARRKNKIVMNITAYRNLIEKSEPFSDIWCYAQNKLVYELYLFEEMTEKR